MPICRRCSKHFPSSKMIEGKRRVFGGRKYCLECSPFGLHNTRPIIGDPLFEKKIFKPHSKICQTCQKEFFVKTPNWRGLNCGTCMAKKHRLKIKTRAVEYKGGKCQICGYNRCLWALVFHHLNPAEKELNLGYNHCRKWEVFRAELDKCVLLCHNCHSEVHAGLALAPVAQVA